MWGPICWAKRSARAAVANMGNNARKRVFGVLNPRTGKRLFSIRYRNWAEDFRDFLRAVRAHCRRWRIFMILDQASSHTAKITRARAEALRIQLAWLPTACPELNPAERLWQRGKQDVCVNRTYPHVNEQATTFVEYLLSFSPEETLRCAGAQSPNFWVPASIRQHRAEMPHLPHRCYTSRGTVMPYNHPAFHEKSPLLRHKRRKRAKRQSAGMEIARLCRPWCRGSGRPLTRPAATSAMACRNRVEAPHADVPTAPRHLPSGRHRSPPNPALWLSSDLLRTQRADAVTSIPGPQPRLVP